MTDKQTIISLRLLVCALASSMIDIIDSAVADIFKSCCDGKQGILVDTTIRLKQNKIECKEFLAYNDKLLAEDTETCSLEDMLIVMRSPGVVFNDKSGNIAELGDALAILVESVMELKEEPKNPKELSKATKLALEQLIDEHFGVYMAVPNDEFAYLDFLPSDELATIIGVSDASLYYEKTQAFMEPIKKLMEMAGVLEEIPKKKEYKAEQIIKKRMNKFFKDYEQLYGVSIQNAMKEAYGICSDHKVPFECCDEKIHIRGRGRNVDIV